MAPARNLLAICAISGFLVASRADAFDRLSHDIAAQPLAQALSEFADRTGLQLVYVSEFAATRASNGAPRGLQAPDALRSLLAGTGLQFEFLNDRTVRIFAGSNCALPDRCVDPPFGAAAPPPGRSSAHASRLDSLEVVIVPGSRWWLNPNKGVAPVTVLNRRDIERVGENSIGDVLQALPMTSGSPLNSSVNVGGAGEPRSLGTAGDGSVRVFLHDLPTVVLLNGRRLPNSGLGADASVDLNTLPISLIERVEVVASGASAAYGADAVGGVVNVVSRRAVHGLELGATRTIAEHGDGEVVTARAAIGLDLLGGTWSLGVDYVDQSAVTMDRRSYSARPLIIADVDGTLVPADHDNLPREARIEVPEGNALGLKPGLYTHVPGATGQTPADYRPYVRERDGFNPAPLNYLQTPNERASLWVLGSRPLGEFVSLFLEGFAQHRESAQQAAPEWYSSMFNGPTLADGLPGIPADNYYNPFRVDVHDVNRRMIEAGNRRSDQEIDLWRVLIGLEGSVARWTWELALQDAKSEATDVEKGFLALERMVSALGPSGLDDSGRVVCGSPEPGTGRVPAADIIQGCVPLNLFGGAGGISEEQLAYVVPGAMINRGTNEQRYGQFILSGPGGKMLDRDLQWVLGANYRRESASLAPDPLHALGISGLRIGGPVSGEYDAGELFVGVQAPLLHDRPWARDMALNVDLRWSDYSSFDSHTTWQAGLRWQPVGQLTLRANYGEVFRAPSLAELYEPQWRSGWDDFDPCGNDPTPTQQANCAASGVPGGAYVQDDGGFLVTFGGNPELEPETGHTLGAGLVYAPAWASGLSASVDYFQAKRSNFISVANPDEILFECAERGSSLCNAIIRQPDGRVIRLNSYYHNSGESDVRAFDLAINWSAMNRIGELKSTLLATYLDRWDKQRFPGGEVNSYAGNFDAGARPRWRAAGHIDWRSGSWMASYSTEYIGSYSERVDPWHSFDVMFDSYYRHVDPVLYHDIEAGFEFDSGVTVRAAITNVTDEDPPYLNIAPGNTDVATYRLLGRSFFLQLRYQMEK